jgi:hypothetical protein
MAAPASAEVVLYCVDTAGNGFAWDKQGKVSRTNFHPARFTVKVISETERMINLPAFGDSTRYICVKSETAPFYHCNLATGSVAFPIIFDPKGYVRARMTKGSQVGVAYGTCTKF